jgi:hypothetical protein
MRRKNREEEIRHARDLRKDGLSPLQISKALGIPKGTIWHWIEDVEVSVEQKEVLQKLKRDGAVAGCRKGSNVFKQRSDVKHQKAFDAGFLEAAKSEVFRIICALYWGEGGKTRRCFAFTNTDEGMVKLVARWVVSKGYDYKLQIVHHDDLNSQEVKDFWMKQLPTLKEENIGKIQIKKHSRKDVKRKMPVGCVHLVVNDAQLHSTVMGGIEFLKGLIF